MSGRFSVRHEENRAKKALEAALETASVPSRVDTFEVRDGEELLTRIGAVLFTDQGRALLLLPDIRYESNLRTWLSNCRPDALVEEVDGKRIPIITKPINNPQQSWGVGCEPLKAVLNEGYGISVS